MPRQPKEPKTSSNSVNLSGSLPKDNKNGLGAIVDELCAQPGLRRIAVVELYAQYVKSSTDDGTDQAIVRFDWIEPMTSEQDAKLCADLMVQAQTSRLGMLDLGDPADLDAERETRRG
jgi:hypothetical protein